MVTVSVVVSVISVLVAADAFFVFITSLCPDERARIAPSTVGDPCERDSPSRCGQRDRGPAQRVSFEQKNNNIRALLACKLSTALLGIPLFRIPSLSSTQGARRLGTNLFVSSHRPSAVT